jgi:hypothetical protein
MKRRPLWIVALAAVGSLVHCGRRSSQGEVRATSDPIASASASASDAALDADADADAARAIPTIACDEGPEVHFSTASATSFTCSPMVTSKAAATAGPSWTDEGGVALKPLDLTVAPGTVVSIPVGVTNDKGAPFPASVLRYEVKGFPPSAKVDAKSTFQWKALGKDGEITAGMVAALVKLPSGEKCVKLPIVVRTHDDDATRANQAASMVRTEQFYRQLACAWAHQGADPAENAHNDLEDERSLRERFACGAPLVDVTMRDLDGDGLADAMVVLAQHLNPGLADNPSGPKFETGPGVQIFLRKGDDFVRLLETPGIPREAVDGTQLFLDTNEVEHASCPPRPYISTGIVGCDITDVVIYRWTGKSVEKLGEVLGDDIPGAGESMNCGRVNLEILDAKKRVTGYRNDKKTYDWKGALTTK